MKQTEKLSAWQGNAPRKARAASQRGLQHHALSLTPHSRGESKFFKNYGYHLSLFEKRGRRFLSLLDFQIAKISDK
jgi:hypothetical protein